MIRKLAIIAVTGALITLGCLASEEPIAIPSLTLSTLDGGTISNLDQQELAVLIFIKPQCESCVEGISALQTASQSYADVPIYVVVPEDSDALRTVVEEKLIDWPIILDTDFLLSSACEVGPIPSVRILRNSKITTQIEPGFTVDDLKAVVEAAVKAADTISIPSLTLTTLNDGTINDLDQQELAVLLFANPECESCFDVISFLQTASQSYPDLPIFLSVRENSDALRVMVQEENIDWPIILDSNLLLSSACEIERVPSVCLIRDGELTARLESDITSANLTKLLDALVEASVEEVSEPNPTDTIYGGFLRFPEPELLIFVGAECFFCHAMLPQIYEVAEWFSVTLVITQEINDLAAYESDATKLTLVLDPQWKIAHLYDVSSVPTFFLWNPDGSLEWKRIGYISDLLSLVERYR